jgi:hypothetical protein
MPKARRAGTRQLAQARVEKKEFRLELRSSGGKHNRHLDFLLPPGTD